MTNTNAMQALLNNAVIDLPHSGKTRNRTKTWKEVNEIRSRLIQGISPEVIAEEFNCSVSSIISINRNTCFYDPGWKMVEQPHKYCHVKLTRRDIRRIREFIAAGMGTERIAVKFKVARQTIMNIKNGNSWKNID